MDCISITGKYPSTKKSFYTIIKGLFKSLTPFSHEKIRKQIERRSICYHEMLKKGDMVYRSFSDIEKELFNIK